ncbi:uncharacterized protein FIBRA_03815 [Fibroporia radiculosa]|uniref:Uncharacterized protein n=1 Tax=Fibroporia radiculosa TaxID=599839 RepID=J4H2L8_9APHY|nr:uncharacterized protein FIBRA_03815 [Fibroporia radiculosa]CCM01749.1 predicted protein [Fibroporia radiculosa]
MSSPAQRNRHRKRISALRLSSDTTVSTLPAYTSPPWFKSSVLSAETEISDRPPDYPDSAEEADADTDSDESHIAYFSPPPPLPVSPRRARNSHSRTFRRQQSSSSEPYLDSLLARSVHALEMSNALLQSSMSTQSSLSAVLASDSMADRSLEARAQMLSTRITGNRDMQENWLDDLDEISQNVQNLVGEVQMQKQDESAGAGALPPEDDCVSRSLPTSGFAERVQRRSHMRRPSLDLRNSGNAQLQYSNHDRSHFIASAPRALTVYIDSTDSPDLITLPSTLGLRSTSQLPPTPLPPMTPPDSGSGVQAASEGQTRRIVNVLSSYVRRPSPPPPPSTSVSTSSPSRLASIMSIRSGRSSSSSSRTIPAMRPSKSPVKPPVNSSPVSTLRSRSLTPMRTSSPPQPPRPMTPPIEELSASSESSSSDTLNVDRTVQSLRSILDRQQSSAAGSPTASRNSTLAPPPRPSFLSPPSVAPVSSTSTATASVSRLFTKSRHSSSTRPPSPPRQSSLKNRSAPPTPVLTSPPPTPTLLGLPDTLRISSIVNGSVHSATSSGRSTPKRISFAELPESYAGSRPEGAPSKLRDKVRSKSKRRGKRADGRKSDGSDKDEGNAWWMGWLLGAAGTGSGSGLSLGATREERVPRSPNWNSRPGYGSALDDWGA